MSEKKSTSIGTIGADTTFLIDFFKGEPKASEFMRRNARMLRVSELSIYEFLCGNLTDSQQQRFLEAIQSFSTTVFNREAAILGSQYFRCSKRSGSMVGHRDCMIAGSYKAFGINTIVTRNPKHFSGLPDLNVIQY